MRNSLLLAAGAAALAASPSLAQTTPAPASQPGTAAPAAATTGPTTPSAGSQVHDAQGAPVGTVVSVAANAIVVDTGAHQVGLPPNAVGPDGKGGFVSSLGKAQLDAAFEQQTAQAAAQLQAKLVSGASVSTAFGSATAGTIKAVDEQYVTLTTTKGDVKLPRNVFALNQAGTLIVKLTADQFNAAIGSVKPAS